LNARTVWHHLIPLILVCCWTEFKAKYLARIALEERGVPHCCVFLPVWEMGIPLLGFVTKWTGKYFECGDVKWRGKEKVDWVCNRVNRKVFGMWRREVTGKWESWLGLWQSEQESIWNVETWSNGERRKFTGLCNDVNRKLFGMWGREVTRKGESWLDFVQMWTRKFMECGGVK